MNNYNLQVFIYAKRVLIWGGGGGSFKTSLVPCSSSFSCAVHSGSSSSGSIAICDSIIGRETDAIDLPGAEAQPKCMSVLYLGFFYLGGRLCRSEINYAHF